MKVRYNQNYSQKYFICQNYTSPDVFSCVRVRMVGAWCCPGSAAITALVSSVQPILTLSLERPRYLSVFIKVQLTYNVT